MKGAFKSKDFSSFLVPRILVFTLILLTGRRVEPPRNGEKAGVGGGVVVVEVVEVAVGDRVVEVEVVDNGAAVVFTLSRLMRRLGAIVGVSVTAA